MKKNLVIFFMVLFICNYSFAQYVINTDMPDQSDGSHILEKKHFQIESAVLFSRLDEYTRGFDNFSMIRYGVTRRFEVRLISQYSSVRDSNFVTGEQPLTISFKNQLCKQHGLLPKLTLVSYFKLPITLSPAFKAEHFGYSFTLAARHQLSNAFKLYTNFGITQDQVTTDISYIGTMGLNCNITDIFSSYIEYFGNYASHTSAANGMDIGFIYALKKNLAVHLALGSTTLKPGSDRFMSFGMSVRLPK